MGEGGTEIPDIGEENDETEGENVLGRGVVIARGMGGKEVKGGLGRFELGEGENHGVDSVGIGRTPCEEGLGVYESFAGVIVVAEGGFEALGDDIVVVGRDGGYAVGERIGVFPGGEDSDGDDGFQSEDGGGEAATKKSERSQADRARRDAIPFSGGKGGARGTDAVEESEEGEGEADGGQVGVAVGDRDGADEDNAGDGEEETCKSEETDGEAGASAKGDHGKDGKAEKEGGARPGNCGSGGEAVGKGHEVGRPKGFGKIEEVVGQERGKAENEGGFGDRPVLKVPGEEGDEDGGEEERPFAEGETREDSGGIAERETAEGPEIEKEEEEGEGDEHGLGEESGNKGCQCKAQATFAAVTSDK